MLSNAAYLKKMRRDEVSFVLVDLRSAEEAAAGHMAEAVSIPSAKLASMKDQFPSDKSAAIVLYAASGVDVESFKLVRGWGYKNTSMLEGGFSAWAAGGGDSVKGEAPVAINYVKRTPKGQISIEDFKKVLAEAPADKVVLDVRDADTVAKGRLAGSVSIPKDELEARAKELPKDKEIIIHCNTGVLASDAYDILSSAGFKARYLNAVVQVRKDGSFEINEK